MRRTSIRRAALFGAIALPIVPALAQEGGVLLTFGVNQRFEYESNPDLDVSGGESRTQAVTRLSFGLRSETQTEKLRFDASTALRLSETDSDGFQSDVDNPRLGFSYSRDGSDSSLTFSANYRQDQVEFLRPLEDFRNEDGVIELPEDFSALQGSGTRRSYGGTLRMDFGKEAPLGFGFVAGLSQIDYTDVSDADLNDIRRENLGATVRLRFSDTTRGRIAVNYNRFTEEDTAQTDRQTEAIRFGVTHDLTSATTLDASIGYSTVDTEEFGVTRTTSKPIYSFGLAQDMPNGSLTVDLDARTESDGTWTSLSFGRVYELANGGLSGRIGLVDPAGVDPELEGEVNWNRELPSGQINARLSRAVSSQTDDQTRISSALSLGYDHGINDVSGIGVDLSLAKVTETNENTVDRTDLSAFYRHALTDDWDLNVGASWTERDEETVGKADSQSVFLTIGRRFTFRP